MCADDDAARRSGRGPLVGALLAMATGAGGPVAIALCASACAVTARLQRLVEVPGRGRRARYALTLASTTVLLALAPFLVAGFAGH
jgi:hypothetical protein